MGLEDAGWPFDDFDSALANLLDSLPSRPRLLALGEPTHLEEAFPRLRNRMLRYLVEHEGYRCVAIESDCVAGLLVDDYVTGGAGSLDDVLRRGFSHRVGEYEATRELLIWLRDFNRNHPFADRVRFAGFDAPLEMISAASPRETLTELHRYLAAHLDAAVLPCPIEEIDRLIGDDALWTATEAMMDPAKSLGGSAEVARLRLIADDMRALLLAESPRLISATSRELWHRAALHARTAAGLLRYHAGLADTSPRRIPRLMGLRDAMMAENLAALPYRTLVFAHNSHLQRRLSVWELAGQRLEWWSAGAIMSAQIGDEYAFVALAVGSAPRHGVAAPAEDTFEGVLSTLPGDAYFFDSRRLADVLDGKILALRKGTASYFPFDPEHLRDTDGIAFLKQVADQNGAGSGIGAGSAIGSGSVS
ncbi:erythromycin esterase family protein [Allokutzneria sp. A3M-2-11 16]|uniref:erythromycin esterase family protein n=1 Tax=Allokutzneria sp. A3M-2-11 16 TaxID=2962043 RepID=UPI0020B85FF2|nr:erythromycin esterase family protein [Allokutzneria sp. A3M-2-11 16]MCP3803762.1 erythromycin esterase family protein [Allokutzneria sp. A3M-2-11 16]